MKGLGLHQLDCGYDGQAVLKATKLTLLRGELCAVLGLNGSGKSTLMKTICGVIPAVSGTCTLDGVSLSEMKTRQRARHISFIPQKSSGVGGVAVEEVLLMGLNPWLRLFEAPGKAQRAQALTVAESMGIGDLIRQDFGKLSEGQKQLVLLTRAVVQNTPVMLMDEPESALDYVNKHEMMRRVSDLVHEQGKIGLIATHDPNVALTYCDRILIVKNQGIVWDFYQREIGHAKVKQALSCLYGNIVVVQHGGKCYMAPGC